MAPILTSSDRRYIYCKYDRPSLSHKSFVQIRSVSFLPVERLLQVSLITCNILRDRRWRCFAGDIYDWGRGWVYTDKDWPALVCLPSMLRRPTLKSNQVEPLTGDFARSLIRQLMSTLEFMHLQRIAHRDAKRTNLLVTTGDIVCPICFSRQRPGRLAVAIHRFHSTYIFSPSSP